MKLTTFIPLLSSIMPAMAAWSDSGNETEYLRPQLHFTAEKGWINDPNGLFYDRKEELYHLYFQFNPNATIWDLPLYWGHATSKDLTHWEEHEAAIGPDHDNEGIFSGSIVVDVNNTSGMFNSSIDPDQRVVALYTLLDSEGIQSQEMAYSHDAGYTFTKYSRNPVINVRSKDFRDPKVFWHEPTSRWIMVAVMSKDFEVVFYGSEDLKSWELLSSFSGGYYSNQYECPGLMHVPIEGTDEKKWVLALAINPGAPIGGSINQYFVGEFNGTHFEAQDHQTRFMDLGKDFYAVQEFSSLPEQDGVLGIAWATNWQYANRAPTYPWKGSMSTVRNYTLRNVNVNVDTQELTLCQLPVMRDINIKNEVNFANMSLNSTTPIHANFTKMSNDSTGAFDFDVVFNILDTSLGPRNLTTFEIVISSQETASGEHETVSLSFDSTNSNFAVNRGNLSNPFMSNNFFNDKISVYVEPLDAEELNYQVYGVVDRDIIEIFFNNGSTAITNTFFMGKDLYPHDIHIETNAEESFINFKSINIRELKA